MRTVREAKEGEVTVGFTVRQEMTKPVGTQGGMVSLMGNEEQSSSDKIPYKKMG